jgi:hypothetical protein
MIARWASFGVGMWLLLAPLLAGYRSVAAILQGVAVGTLVCVATLAALDWPRARFGLAGLALWIALDGRTAADSAAAAVSVASGTVLFVLSLVPSARRPPVAAARAGARA